MNNTNFSTVKVGTTAWLEKAFFPAGGTPSDSTASKYKKVQKAAAEFAQLIVDTVPECGDQYNALQTLRNVTSLCYSAISHEGSI